MALHVITVTQGCDGRKEINPPSKRIEKPANWWSEPMPGITSRREIAHSLTHRVQDNVVFQEYF
jgi:hypothetical protein